MRGGLRTPQLVLVGATVAAGLAGTFSTLAGRNADAQFLEQQRHPVNLQPEAVEHAVRSAPDPATGKGSGTGAVCESHGRGLIGNPWVCVVDYSGGRRIRVAVTVNLDGTYFGTYAKGGAVEGCCVNLPGTQ
jgi:hypothetical protein